VPGVGDDLDRETNNCNLVMSDSSGVQGRSMSRIPAAVLKERHRSHSADDICAAVNALPINPIHDEEAESPIPGDGNDMKNNDLKNVLFLAEQESDNWNADCCTEDDDSTDTSGSESDVPSDSYDHEDASDDFCSTPTVVMTDRLRQLASSSYTVPKKNQSATDTQSTPIVKGINLPVINIIPDEEEELVEDPREQDLVRFVDSGTAETTNGDDDALSLRDFEDWVRCVDFGNGEIINRRDSLGVVSLGDEDSVRCVDCGNAEATNGDVVGVSSPRDAIGEESVQELKPFTDDGRSLVINPIPDEDTGSAAVTPVPDEECLPEDQHEEESVEVVGSGNTETTEHSDDVVVSDLRASVSEELVPELSALNGSDRSESKDEIHADDTVESLANPSLPESTEDFDDTDRSSNAMVAVVVSDPENTSAVPSEMSSTSYTEQRSSECERLSFTDDGYNTVLADFAEHSNRGDSVGNACSRSETSSISHRSSEEYSDASIQDVRSLTSPNDDTDAHLTRGDSIGNARSTSETSSVSYGISEDYFDARTRDIRSTTSATSDTDELFARGNSVGNARSKLETSANRGSSENYLDASMQDIRSISSATSDTDELFARGDSVGSARSKSTSSASRRSSEEYFDASMQHVRSVTAATEDELFYTSPEPNSAVTETRGAEVVSGLSDNGGSLEGKLRPRRNPNSVYQLARAYSRRVKEISASTSMPPRRRVIRRRKDSEEDDLKEEDSPSSSVRCRFLPTRIDEDSETMSPPAAESGDFSGYDAPGRWEGGGGGMSRAKSMEEIVSFPRTSVRETIRKLKQKADLSDVPRCRPQPRIFTRVSESSRWPTANAEDSPGQFVAVDSPQRPSTTRQTSALVQERVRMLRDTGGFD